jgi:acetyl-CoA acetyltransferase family protein
MAWLGAGLPETVPSVTIDRRCGSSQQALHFAAQGIRSGDYDMVVVAGIESMSRVPMKSARLGQDAHGPSVEKRYSPGLVSQGIAAELVAQKWALSRDQLDRYAAASHERAAGASASGRFDREIVPVHLDDASDQAVTRDETIRPGTTVDTLRKLEPAFRDEASVRRFPDLEWRVTAGNSSQLADAAGAMLLMSESAVERFKTRPRARVHAMSVCAEDPILMLTGPISATRLVMRRSGLAVSDMDSIEVNEAFASVPLAWLHELEVDPRRLNPCGGAIALGHPLGASGVRLATTLLNQLEVIGGRYGLQTMCEGGGMANATIIERLP